MTENSCFGGVSASFGQDRPFTRIKLPPGTTKLCTHLIYVEFGFRTKFQARWCIYCPPVIAKAVTSRPHAKPGTTLRRGQLVPPGRENWSRVLPWCPDKYSQTTARNDTHTSPTKKRHQNYTDPPTLLSRKGALGKKRSRVGNAMFLHKCHSTLCF